MFAVVGLLGALLAGMIVMDPFGDDGSDSAVEADEATSDGTQDAQTTTTENILDSIDEGADPDGGSAQQTADAFTGFGQTFEDDETQTTGSADAGEGPDLEDHVYGHNIGDQKGAALFQKLLFDDHAITGAPGDDDLSGSSAGDLMFGNEGNDSINSDAGDDLIHGDEGDDLILTGTGNDAAYGDDGNDRLDAGAGNDLVVGGEGDDTLLGGQGDDRLFGQFGADVLEGGDGNDTLDGTQARSVSTPGIDEDIGDTLNGGAGNDVLILGSGDMASGGAGEDTFVTGDYVDAGAIPVISDFDPAEDLLEVFVDPDDIGGAELSAHNSDAGLEVRLDGVPVAQITNIQDIDLDRIRLIPLTAA